MGQSDSSSSVSTSESTIVTRTVTFLGMGFLSICFALVATQSWGEWAPIARVGFGAGMAALLLLVGTSLSWLLKERWLGSSLIASGYALAYFFAFASHYLDGMIVFSNPAPSWALQIGIAALCTLHGLVHPVLKWFSLPFTLAMGGHLFARILLQGGDLDLGLFSLSSSVFASVASIVWCGGLCALYRRQVAKHEAIKDVDGAMLYRVTHELYFVLAAASAVVVPIFSGDWQLAPLVWSVQVVVLLSLCWRKNEVFKHVVTALLAVGAAVLAGLFHATTLSAVLAFPTMAIMVGLSYRFHADELDVGQRRAFYYVYIYGAAIVAFLAPLTHLGIVAGMPYSVLVAAAILPAWFVLRDGALFVINQVQCAAALVGFGYAVVVTLGGTAPVLNWVVYLGVVAIAYAGSYLFLYAMEKLCVVTPTFSRWNGVAYQEDWPALQTAEFFHPDLKFIVERESMFAYMWAYGILGYLALMIGAFTLAGGGAYATAAWGLIAILTSILGVSTALLPHRFSGWVALGLCAGKAMIYDFFWGTGGIILSFGAVGVSALVVAVIYAIAQRKLAAASPAPTTETQG